MTFTHADVTRAELIDEPEGDGEVVVILNITTALSLDVDSAAYRRERIDALLAAIEQYKSDNPQIDRVRLASESN